MTALIRGASCTVGPLLLLACTAGTPQNQLPTVFTTYDSVKLAVGIYAFIPAEDASAFVRGNSVLIFGSNGALVLDSGHVPGVTKRMTADITRLTSSQCVFSSPSTGIPTMSPATASIAATGPASPS